MSYNSTFSGAQIDASVRQSNTNKNDIETLSNTVSTQNATLNALNLKVSAINNNSIPNLESMISQKADSNLVKLQNDYMSSAMADKQQQIDSIKDTVSRKADINYVNTEIANLQDNFLSSGNVAIANLGTRVATNETEISSLKTFTTNLDQTIVTNVSRIDNNITKLETNFNQHTDSQSILHENIDTEIASIKDNYATNDFIMAVQEEVYSEIDNIYFNYLDLETYELEKANFVTNESLANYASKNDLNNYVTTENLESKNFLTSETLPNFLSSYVEKATYEAKIKELEDLIAGLSAKITALEENKNNVIE